MTVSPKLLISAGTEPFNTVHSSITKGNDATSNGQWLCRGEMDVPCHLPLTRKH